MNGAVLAAAVTAVATLIVAVISHVLTRKRELKLKDLQFKLDKYAEFLASFAELGSANKTREAHVRFANATNTLNLFASRQVLEDVYELLDYMRRDRDVAYSVPEQDEILNNIIASIRRDLGEKKAADFRFRLISPGT